MIPHHIEHKKVPVGNLNFEMTAIFVLFFGLLSKDSSLKMVIHDANFIFSINPFDTEHRAQGKNTGFPLFRNHKIPGFFKEFNAIFQVYFCIGS